MTKVLPTIFAFLFAILFTVFGISAGISPLAEIAGKWKSSRSFVQVPAQVTSAEYTVHKHKKGVSTSIKAVFHYKFDGSDYDGDSVSLNFPPEEVKEAIQRQLSQAKLHSLPVQLWVNPKYPAESVYDRDVYVGEIMLHLILGIMFLLVGWGAFAGIVYVCYPRASVTRVEGFRDGNTVRVPAELGGVYLLLWGVFWAAGFWPTVFLMFQSESFDMLGKVIFSVLALLGLLFFSSAWTNLKKEWFTGKPVLDIDSVTPLRAHVCFYPAVGMRLPPTEPTHRVVIEAKLMRSGPKGEITEVWKECLLDRQVARGTERLSFEVSVPARTEDCRLEIALQIAGADYAFHPPRSIQESLPVATA